MVHWYARWYLRLAWAVLALAATPTILVGTSLLIFWDPGKPDGPDLSAADVVPLLAGLLSLISAPVAAGFAVYVTRPRPRPVSGWYGDPMTAAPRPHRIPGLYRVGVVVALCLAVGLGAVGFARASTSRTSSQVEATKLSLRGSVEVGHVSDVYPGSNSTDRYFIGSPAKVDVTSLVIGAVAWLQDYAPATSGNQVQLALGDVAGGACRVGVSHYQIAAGSDVPWPVRLSSAQLAALEAGATWLFSLGVTCGRG